MKRSHFPGDIKIRQVSFMPSAQQRLSGMWRHSHSSSSADWGGGAQATVTKVIFDSAPVPLWLSHYTGSFPDADVYAPEPLFQWMSYCEIFLFQVITERIRIHQLLIWTRPWSNAEIHLHNLVLKSLSGNCQLNIEINHNECPWLLREREGCV